MKAAVWIDQVKAAHGWASDYRVAQALGRTKATISAYRAKPDATMDDATAVTVARLLETEPALVILDQVAERTRSDEARAALLRLLELHARPGGARKKNCRC